ncbi:hypothetical protein D4R89_07765 [bacterium]|nr:MAG: hypothetical protein D4R89_07765 [bacterium]
MYGSLPFSVGWVNSLDGTALDGHDVKRRAWRRALLPAPIKIRLSSNGDTDLLAPLIDQGGLGGLIELKQSLGRVSVFSAPQAQDSRLI